MGSLFGGPSARRVARESARAEEKARKEEQERLRLQEQKMRQRESTETMQGEGIASTGNVIFGTDLSEESTGTERVEAAPIAPEVEAPTMTREQQIQALRDRLANGEFNLQIGGQNR